MELNQYSFKAIDSDGDSTIITVVSDNENNAKKIAEDQANSYGMVLSNESNK
jgi:hypothetical protein